MGERPHGQSRDASGLCTRPAAPHRRPDHLTAGGEREWRRSRRHRAALVPTRTGLVTFPSEKAKERHATRTTRNRAATPRSSSTTVARNTIWKSRFFDLWRSGAVSKHSSGGKRRGAVPRALRRRAVRINLSPCARHRGTVGDGSRPFVVRTSERENPQVRRIGPTLVTQPRAIRVRCGQARPLALPLPGVPPSQDVTRSVMSRGRADALAALEHQLRAVAGLRSSGIGVCGTTLAKPCLLARHVAVLRGFLAGPDALIALRWMRTHTTRSEDVNETHTPAARGARRRHLDQRSRRRLSRQEWLGVRRRRLHRSALPCRHLACAERHHAGVQHDRCGTSSLLRRRGPDADADGSLPRAAVASVVPAELRRRPGDEVEWCRLGVRDTPRRRSRSDRSRRPDGRDGASGPRGSAGAAGHSRARGRGGACRHQRHERRQRCGWRLGAQWRRPAGEHGGQQRGLLSRHRREHPLRPEDRRHLEHVGFAAGPDRPDGRPGYARARGPARGPGDAGYAGCTRCDGTPRCDGAAGFDWTGRSDRSDAVRPDRSERRERRAQPARPDRQARASGCSTATTSRSASSSACRGLPCSS